LLPPDPVPFGGLLGGPLMPPLLGWPLWLGSSGGPFGAGWSGWFGVALVGFRDS